MSTLILQCQGFDQACKTFPPEFWEGTQCRAEEYVDGVAWICQTIAELTPLVWALVILIRAYLHKFQRIIRDDLTNQVACIMIHVDTKAETPTELIRYRGIYEKNTEALFGPNLYEILLNKAGSMNPNSASQAIVPLPKRHAWKFLTWIEASLNAAYCLGTIAKDQRQLIREEFYACCITLLTNKFVTEVKGQTYAPDEDDEGGCWLAFKKLVKYYWPSSSFLSWFTSCCNEKPKESGPKKLQTSAQGSVNVKTSKKFRIFVTKESNLQAATVSRVKSRLLEMKAQGKGFQHKAIKDPSKADEYLAKAKKLEVPHQQLVAFGVLQEMVKYLKSPDRSHLIKMKIPIQIPVFTHLSETERDEILEANSAAHTAKKDDTPLDPADLTRGVVGDLAASDDSVHKPDTSAFAASPGLLVEDVTSAPASGVVGEPGGLDAQFSHVADSPMSLSSSLASPNGVRPLLTDSMREPLSSSPIRDEAVSAEAGAPLSQKRLRIAALREALAKSEQQLQIEQILLQQQSEELESERRKAAEEQEVFGLQS
eukprot:NODE_876_length_1724_cov_11.648955_g714_i0.p1 GENE.NODE_876_length_1724_cov_11.648955_g714_i0~~NODE_876_length_1724_cov_11.648955_g714_i0.p1  ORF type:complete len:540 (-),score=113.94 NODE_876_length_1724_cov_11.648955_g714_i0:51-1670(-)